MTGTGIHFREDSEYVVYTNRAKGEIPWRAGFVSAWLPYDLLHADILVLVCSCVKVSFCVLVCSDVLFSDCSVLLVCSGMFLGCADLQSLALYVLLLVSLCVVLFLGCSWVDLFLWSSYRGSSALGELLCPVLLLICSSVGLLFGVGGGLTRCRQLRPSSRWGLLFCCYRLFCCYLLWDKTTPAFTKADKLSLPSVLIPVNLLHKRLYSLSRIG